jgi:hypothetical protein
VQLLDLPISSVKPLGLILQQAALVSSAQVEIALHDCQKYEDLRIGEVLALRGWIEAKTADFFAEKWSLLLKQKWEHPIGYYFEEAALLARSQIEAILVEQTQLSGLEKSRFGEMAIAKKWIKPETVEFFVCAQQQCSKISNLSEIVDRILRSGRINRLEQERFLRAMMQREFLSASEQAGIQKICQQIQQGRLRVILE